VDRQRVESTKQKVGQRYLAGLPMSPVPMAHPEKSASTLSPTGLGVVSRLVADRLVQNGIDIDPLLGRLGISKGLLTDRSSNISARSQVQFINMAASALKDDLLGFHVARDADAREKGPFYYLLSSSAKLSTALDHAIRYVGELHEALRLSKGKSPSSIEYELIGVERYSDRHQIEYWVTYTLRVSRILSGRELIPLQVQFVHTRSHGGVEMERYFGCRIEFGASKDRITFEAQEVDLPVLTADPFLNRFMIDYFEGAAAQQITIREPLRIRVENSILPRLPNGNASIGNVASDLGMSARTLSRRLAEEGLAFSAILEELRSSLANQYLYNSDLLISEISWRLGYTEVSSFVHAFQRWTGKSPTHVRRQLGDVDRKGA
jgi:AraC-like DNA-binding protein